MMSLADTGTNNLPLDYIHLNSVAEAPDGELIISARNTSAIYKVSRSTGETTWRFDGRKSDFAVDTDARGGAVIGWGAQPNISEFDDAGRMVWDARMPDVDQSYRAFVFEGWSGSPVEKPAMAARGDARTPLRRRGL